MPFRRSDRKCFYLAAYIRIGLRGGGVERPGKRKELWGAAAGRMGKRKEPWGTAAGRMGKRKVLQKVLVEHNAERQKVPKKRSATARLRHGE